MSMEENFSPEQIDALFDIAGAASKVVVFWKTPQMQGLTRSERKFGLGMARVELIKAVEAWIAAGNSSPPPVN